MRLCRINRNKINTFICNNKELSHNIKDKILSVKTMNQAIVQAEYAVRGTLVLKANEYQKEMIKNPINHNFPFNKIVECNIGNPHALNQRPLTFPRQVLALLNYPDLLNHPIVSNIFASDAIQRAKNYLGKIPGGTGAYSHSKGILYIREEVAAFLEKRDNAIAHPEDIFLTDGASQAVQTILRTLIRSKDDGILVPIPQYPLYSAAITLNGGTLIKYYLDEKLGWKLKTKELKEAINRINNKINVRALVIINPGNPTGQCLSKENIIEIIKFCYDENLIIMADEVYQENIYSKDRSFISFKKVLFNGIKEEHIRKNVELISFHSTSKGFFGECGRRGGYMELVNINDDVKEQLYKLASVGLCSNVEGQIMVGLMSNPPKEGDESYTSFIEEKEKIINSLKIRSIKLVKAFNSMEGISCNKSEGSLYVFPKIKLPEKFILKAKNENIQPDTLYCLKMLKETGVVVVPGSGFGQEEGTWHFRSTILPQEEEIDEVIERTKKFHLKFMKKYK